MKMFMDRVAAVTGASSGIGRALALELASRGSHLALCSFSNQEELAETARLAALHGVKVTVAKVDVSKRDQVHAWADQVVRDHGVVHMVFNNAGVAFAGSVADASCSDYEWLMGINFWGVVHGTKAFLPHLEASGKGHIINMSSVFGLFSSPGMSAYNSSKFAVRGFTESLRQELELANSSVSATCVHPGGVRTNIAASARLSETLDKLPEETKAGARKTFEVLLRTTTPERAARAILRGVEKNSRRVLVGVDAHAADFMQRFLPSLHQWFVVTAMRLIKRWRG